MNRKQINWLLGEIDTWNSEGLIGAETALQLKSRYELLKQDHRSVGLMLLASLGALLVGLGIISLLAANWGNIPRDMRAVISFVPLIISYGAALYCRQKMVPTPAFCEPLGIFWGLSVGAGIALISQTYHLPGDMETFIMTWMLLLVPVAWLTRSVGAVAGFYIGLLFWAGYVEHKLGTGIWYWPVSALVLPVVISVKRRTPRGMRGIFMFWSLMISSVIALGMTLDKSLPGLWIIIYVSFFTVMLLWGHLSDGDEAEIWARPLSLCGAGGLAVVLYLLSYEWPWHNIGLDRFRSGYGHYLWVSIMYDFSLAALLFVLALFLFFRWRKRFAGDSRTGMLTKVTYTCWYAAPLVVTVIFGLASYAKGDAEELCSLITCVYVAALSLLTIAEGVGSKTLWMINCGMLVFLALVIGKFFSEDYSFTLKGIVFIVSGVIFFVVNLIFGRKLRKEVRS